MGNSSSKITNYSIDAAVAQKILRPLSYVQGFHFFTPNGAYTGETAISLFTFLKELEAINLQSIRYHFQRGDFQRWIRTTLGDAELAERIDKLDRQISDENLRKELIEILKRRLTELQSLTESP